MGCPLAESMAKSSVFEGSKLRIYDHNPDKLMRIQEQGVLDTFNYLGDCLPEADIIFLAVKPYQIDELFEEMRPFVHKNQVFVSIMAGVKLQTIIDGLGVPKVVRTMPNLPAKIRKGVTAYTQSEAISDEELKTVRSLLAMTGSSIYVDSEELIDASTSISGTGPAYVFYFMQSLLEAAKNLGFSEKDSLVLVSSTFEGAVQLFNNADYSPQVWIDRVASKGGTTEAALKFMNENRVMDLIKEAAVVAFDRAVELGKK